MRAQTLPCPCGIRAGRSGEGSPQMRKIARPSLTLGLLLALVAGSARGQRAEPDGFVVQPVEADWSAVVPGQLDPSRALPWPDSDHADSLRGRVERFVAARWTDAEGVESATGDVLEGLLRLRGDDAALGEGLAAARARWPEAFDAYGDLLADFVRDRGVRKDDWLPSRGGADDGFHVGPVLQLGKAPMPDWREVRGSKAVQQAATLIEADLLALELAENDYRAYLAHVGTTYESIFPLDGSLLRSSEDAEAPFASLRIAFVCDLPFPFTNYSCELQVLKRLGPGGLLQTDTWSGSRDFFWIAGSNVYVPVETGEGGFVGMVAVRTFGFDLRGVPDGDSDRLAGLRAVLGNLKRGAERVFAERDEDRELVLRGVIPAVPVLGRRG